MDPNNPAVVAAYAKGKRDGREELKRELLDLLGAFDRFAPFETDD